MTAYDEVPYPGRPYRYAHPDRMCTIARLLGVDAAAAQRCRVLELGCGDGANLIPVALAFPESRFLGIDLAAGHIRQGQALIGELALTNIALQQLDVLELGDDAGEFDYVIAYGLYSWAPEAVRERTLALARACLAPNGVAYINYNACPGARLRQALREMMLWVTRDAQDPGERARRAQAFLKDLASSPAATPEYGAFLRAEARRLAEREIPFLHHDELGQIYAPAYFHEFMARARAHGLEYLAEATLSDTHTEPAGTDEADIVAREQHLDFLKCRAFRQTLLCRREAGVDHRLRPEVVAQLYAASSATVKETGGQTEFRTAGGGLTTAHPVAVRVITRLAEAWPRTLPASEVIREAGEEHAQAVCQILLSAFAGNVVELYSVPPRVSPEPGERPVASPLARLQARHGETIVTTLLHTYIALQDERARRLITLLDGTRDRAALVREMSAAAQGAPCEQVARDLEESLASLARLGLLLA